MKKLLSSKLIGIYLRGLAMGTADVIPGISGGSIALITGIYSRLIRALESFHMKYFLSILSLIVFFYHPKRRQKEWEKLKKLDWLFLIVLAAGIFTALVCMVRVIPFILEHYAYYCYAFFSGLILASASLPMKRMHKKTIEFLIVLIFFLFFFYLTGFSNASLGSKNPWVLFYSGALAICVMILPGISGSYVLVLLGQYKIITEAARDGEWNVLLYFILGMGLGILSFVRILRFFLDHYFSYTMAALTGMMLGSLRGIWPLSYMPTNFSYQQAIFFAIAFAFLGFLLVFILEFLSKSKKIKN